MRCITSGRLTPAAATLTRISPAPGVGTGRASGVRTSGPPGVRIAIAVICRGIEVIGMAFEEHRAANCRPSYGAAADVTTTAAADKVCEGRPEMPAIDEDDKPKKKIAHEIGQDLALLSVGELAERIGLLKYEIARLDAEMAKKRVSQNAANQFFKK